MKYDGLFTLNLHCACRSVWNLDHLRNPYVSSSQQLFEDWFFEHLYINFLLLKKNSWLCITSDFQFAVNRKTFSIVRRIIVDFSNNDTVFFTSLCPLLWTTIFYWLSLNDLSFNYINISKYFLLLYDFILKSFLTYWQIENDGVL